ncbi:DegT/DnrJ/EryC1/StrS family aminotransferase [Profundibacter amoris]|uniref:DegT/DnrJ/EryC1/StrS family aminotransferase n=1 Tax=Profundibacter amoris TaxID=2171755 RepID=A0A347UGG9_9RHOB|nr:DegT/DnrJ/EryC1/StrS family aminotransferase [Profundibacter amoris]AXX97947.1 DegT/DnrJ/EryC1/StrS family aminotransferase [Profundibacter amoris]
MPGFELIGQEERDALNALMDEGGVFFAHGFDAKRKRYHVRELESDFREFLSCHDALCVSSGTAAIKVALKSLGVGFGDEVITQGFNFIADFEAIIDCGATPVVAGSDDTLNMDPAQLEGLITDKTKAIMPVHMLGVPARLDEIFAIAARHNIPVIEDACEAIGAKYNGRYAGTLGAAGVFSFDYGKAITTGEGGLVILNDEKMAVTARQYHDHGHMNLPDIPRGLDRAGVAGFNYRMSELNAVVGKVQLKKLDYIVAESGKRYKALDQGITSGVYKKRAVPEGAEPAYDTYIVEVADAQIREHAIQLLGDMGFGTKNLPDAMNWHCSVFWDHMGFDTKTQAQLDTLALLERQIAIPVMLGKPVEDFAELAVALNGLTG